MVITATMETAVGQTTIAIMAILMVEHTDLVKVAQLQAAQEARIQTLEE